MLGVYAALALLLFARRIEGGTYIASNHIFLPAIGVLLVVMVYETLYSRALLASVRRGVLFPEWRLGITAVIELVGPAAVLLVLHYWSPSGEFTALTAPAVLVFPITIMLSTLRLRPWTTLWLGIGAGVFHAALVADAIRHDPAHFSQLSALFSYGVLLTLTGIAGMVATRVVRRYVAEAVEEAEAHERAGLKLAAIERDLEVAKQIQLGLLPAHSPSVRRVRYRGDEPARGPDGRRLLRLAGTAQWSPAGGDRGRDGARHRPRAGDGGLPGIFTRYRAAGFTPALADGASE
jgi:hypothetical protein